MRQSNPPLIRTTAENDKIIEAGCFAHTLNYSNRLFALKCFWQVPLSSLIFHLPARNEFSLSHLFWITMLLDELSMDYRWIIKSSPKILSDKGHGKLISGLKTNFQVDFSIFSIFNKFTVTKWGIGRKDWQFQSFVSDSKRISRWPRICWQQNPALSIRFESTFFWGPKFLAHSFFRLKSLEKFGFQTLKFKVWNFDRVSSVRDKQTRQS